MSISNGEWKSGGRASRPPSTSQRPSATTGTRTPDAGRSPKTAPTTRPTSTSSTAESTPNAGSGTHTERHARKGESDRGARTEPATCLGPPREPEGSSLSGVGSGGIAREPAAARWVGSRTECDPFGPSRRGVAQERFASPEVALPSSFHIHRDEEEGSGRGAHQRRPAQGHQHADGARPSDANGDRRGAVREHQRRLSGPGAVRGSLEASPVGGGRLPRRGPFARAASRCRWRASSRRARQARCSSAGVLPGPRQEDRPRRRRVDRTRRPGRQRPSRGGTGRRHGHAAAAVGPT